MDFYYILISSYNAYKFYFNYIKLKISYLFKKKFMVYSSAFVSTINQ